MVLPFDYARFPAAARARNLLVQLPPATLAAQLADEYVFAEINEALTLSLAVENEARVAAMTEARSNVESMLDRLAIRRGQLRQ
ncbi:F0F1 ATP synthase subunit gamma [Lutibaculum baratangense]|uniref:Sodium-transporting ATPase subunit G n=1 Tax=Lutibaculum baratangense AMV1 TaxID=631454 RepID=V4RL66_9HYPH|nr:F0F1 ATP synthase subunit gamma [Lutibaculum baratangense]ESR23960.1 Sodium-transporting ATPase subunit G [Lutibaculum baratangense AMV1]